MASFFILTKCLMEGGPNIRVFTYNAADSSFELLDGYMAYQETFRAKINMVATDIDNDGKAEIITVPAEKGGPNIRVYSFNSTTARLELVDWFMAYQDNFYWGVNLTVANVSGDANKEIIVAPNSPGGPNIRVYGYDSTTEKFSLTDWFWAYAESFRGGVKVTAGK